MCMCVDICVCVHVFIQDPDPGSDPELSEKSDPDPGSDPKKIIPDPQHWTAPDPNVFGPPGLVRGMDPDPSIIMQK
jgi:hypothetical protein